MNFDEIIDRRGTHNVKWDEMQAIYGVSPDDGDRKNGHSLLSPQSGGPRLVKG